MPTFYSNDNNNVYLTSLNTTDLTSSSIMKDIVENASDVTINGEEVEKYLLYMTNQNPKIVRNMDGAVKQVFTHTLGTKVGGALARIGSNDYLGSMFSAFLISGTDHISVEGGRLFYMLNPDRAPVVDVTFSAGVTINGCYCIVTVNSEAFIQENGTVVLQLVSVDVDNNNISSLSQHAQDTINQHFNTLMQRPRLPGLEGVVSKKEQEKMSKVGYNSQLADQLLSQVLPPPIDSKVQPEKREQSGGDLSHSPLPPDVTLMKLNEMGMNNTILTASMPTQSTDGTIDSSLSEKLVPSSSNTVVGVPLSIEHEHDHLVHDEAVDSQNEYDHNQSQNDLFASEEPNDGNILIQEGGKEEEMPLDILRYIGEKWSLGGGITFNGTTMSDCLYEVYQNSLEKKEQNEKNTDISLEEKDNIEEKKQSLPLETDVYATELESQIAQVFINALGEPIGTCLALHTAGSQSLTSDMLRFLNENAAVKGVDNGWEVQPQFRPNSSIHYKCDSSGVVYATQMFTLSPKQTGGDKLFLPTCMLKLTSEITHTETGVSCRFSDVVVEQSSQFSSRQSETLARMTTQLIQRSNTYRTSLGKTENKETLNSNNGRIGTSSKEQEKWENKRERIEWCGHITSKLDKGKYNDSVSRDIKRNGISVKPDFNCSQYFFDLSLPQIAPVVEEPVPLMPLVGEAPKGLKARIVTYFENKLSSLGMRSPSQAPIQRIEHTHLGSDKAFAPLGGDVNQHSEPDSVLEGQVQGGVSIEALAAGCTQFIHHTTEKLYALSPVESRIQWNIPKSPMVTFDGKTVCFFLSWNNPLSEKSEKRFSVFLDMAPGGKLDKGLFIQNIRLMPFDKTLTQTEQAFFSDLVDRMEFDDFFEEVLRLALPIRHEEIADKKENNEKKTGMLVSVEGSIEENRLAAPPHHQIKHESGPEPIQSESKSSREKITDFITTMRGAFSKITVPVIIQKAILQLAVTLLSSVFVTGMMFSVAFLMEFTAVGAVVGAVVGLCAGLAIAYTVFPRIDKELRVLDAKNTVDNESSQQDRVVSDTVCQRQPDQSMDRDYQQNEVPSLLDSSEEEENQDQEVESQSFRG